MKAVVAAFNQEKALEGAFSVITNLRMELFEALHVTDDSLLVTADVTMTSLPPLPSARPMFQLSTHKPQSFPRLKTEGGLIDTAAWLHLSRTHTKTRLIFHLSRIVVILFLPQWECK